MDAITSQLIAVGLVNIVMLPILAALIKRGIEKRLDAFDSKRDEARVEQQEAERVKIKQREAERTIILAMSRTMLLDNYEKCVAKGCYTVEEREVYHKLYEAYKDDGGNSVIDDIAPRIRRLPLEPPDGNDRRRHHDTDSD
ncbi:MAG: hypothetical protein IKG21_13260 [Atopobiaceae bacterium]|nr:hypothetical protein [Atopobiaceae bacterium]